MHAMTDLDTPNLVVWPKWCYASAPKETEPQGLALNNNSTTTNNNNNDSTKEKDSTLCPARACKKTRREAPNGTSKEHAPCGEVGVMPTNANGNVKAERLSPDPGTDGVFTQVSPSPSTPPKSPGSHRTRTPSFAGTPPNPAFTPPTTTLHPPYERFSPATLGAVSGISGAAGTVKQMETLVARNCSDLMRSLAAKYNNSSPNDYFSTPSNGFLRSSLSNISPFKGVTTPFIAVSPPSVNSADCRESEKKAESSPISTLSTNLPQSIPPPGAPPLFPGHGIPGFPGFPLVDMSSTQVLLNMVRNASAAQQSQLENYLRGAMKRPADTPTSPLDLSASVAAKRPRTDLGRNFDVKNFFPEGERRPETTKVSSPPAASPTGTKPPSMPSPGANIPPSSGRVSAWVPCSDRNCPSLEGVLHWTVEDVCDFVRGIDLCAEYAEAFREHRIDGSSLPLLTEDHLTTSIHMKLGPALKLRSVLARKLGSCGVCLHCAHCHSLPTTGERRPTSASSGQ